jgi:hypothetical protein
MLRLCSSLCSGERLSEYDGEEGGNRGCVARMNEEVGVEDKVEAMGWGARGGRGAREQETRPAMMCCCSRCC